MSPRSFTPSLRAGVGVRVGAWLSLLVVAGLLAMHGLGAHGSMTTSGSMTSAEPSMHGTPAPSAAPPEIAAVATTAVVAEAHMVAPVAPAHGAHHVMASCMVVLSFALLLLLGVLPTGSQRRTPTVPDELVRLLRRARDPDPPDLVRLCVCRC